jgi:multidrug efflux pump subunit AcrA (membrane-fusion protein)
VDVLIYVDEPELGRVQVGAPVRITSDAYPQKHWECRIDRLPAEVVALDTRRVGEVHCTVEDAAELIPNLRVSVEIESASATNVLTLPREAVVREGNRSSVWIVNERGEAERREVEVGLASANRVEIRSGLSESGRVLLPGQQALAPGLAVQLERRQETQP